MATSLPLPSNSRLSALAGSQNLDLAEHFHLERTPSLSVRCGRSGVPMTVTRVSSELPSNRQSLPLAPDDSYLVLLHFKPLPSHRHWQDGSERTVSPCQPGSVTISHLPRRPLWLFPFAFDALAFLLPQTALDVVSREHAGRATQGLRCPDGRVDRDAYHLAACLLSALQDGADNRLCAEHVMLAFRAHIAQRYGGLGAAREFRGGLSFQQVRRAKEMLAASLQDRTTLEEISQAIGLSRSHFIRAFRESVGETPHRWLTARKLEEARRLLAESDLPLTEIALVCGFSDQSHLTRIFSRHAGTPPGAWRRALG